MFSTLDSMLQRAKPRPSQHPHRWLLDRHAHVIQVDMTKPASSPIHQLQVEPLPDMSTRLESRAPVLKAGKPVIWTQSDQVTIR